MICEKCRWDYPDKLVNEMAVGNNSKQLLTFKVCGICALAISNEIAGTNRTEFRGNRAEELRQRAIKWRADNKESATD